MPWYMFCTQDIRYHSAELQPQDDVISLQYIYSLTIQFNIYFIDRLHCHGQMSNNIDYPSDFSTRHQSKAQSRSAIIYSYHQVGKSRWSRNWLNLHLLNMVLAHIVKFVPGYVKVKVPIVVGASVTNRIHPKTYMCCSCFALFCCGFPANDCIDINSLWPSDVIWQQGTRSTLAQVMACCLTAPSHYLNQCWLMISEVLWHSPDSNFNRKYFKVLSYDAIIPQYKNASYKCKILFI